MLPSSVMQPQDSLNTSSSNHSARDGLFFSSMQQGILRLSDGTSFEGWCPSWQNRGVAGEVVFTTGMTGYVATLTDPSFAGQIITFTFPLIGNYGAKEQWESDQIQAAGAIFCNLTDTPQPLVEWLKQQNVPFLTGVDSRSLTKRLREEGVMLGQFSPASLPPCPLVDPNAEHLVSRTSCKQKTTVREGAKKVIVVDCGMKKNIVRMLETFDVTLEVVPFDYDYSKQEYDGVLLSNGPGNPEQCEETIAVLKRAMKKKKPIFGICLGSQLMALAAGAKTYKLRYGHRGQNQPCIDVKTNRCLMTSQNHGYAVDEATLPKGWIVTHKNLNDDTVEGIRHETEPLWAVQFHPEACPGPTDSGDLFQEFIDSL